MDGVPGRSMVLTKNQTRWGTSPVICLSPALKYVKIAWQKVSAYPNGLLVQRSLKYCARLIQRLTLASEVHIIHNYEQINLKQGK